MKEVIAGLLLAIGTASTQAAIVTYEYTASVGFIQVPAGSLYDSVSSTSLPGFYTELGETVTGTLTYDTSAAALNASDDAATYGWGSVASSVTFSGSGHRFTGSAYTLMTVTNGWSDSVSVHEPYLDGQPPPVEFGLRFFGDSASVLSSTAPPWTELRNFEYMAFSYRTSDSDVFISGAITSLQLTSPIPEPASIGMLLAGLGVVALRRRMQNPRRVTP